MTDIDARHDQIAEYVAAFFGGSARAQTDTDTNTGNKILILRSDDYPEIGSSSFSTVGLSDKNLVIDAHDFGFGVEICGAIDSDQTNYIFALADIAFNLAEGKWIAARHTVFPDALDPYFRDSEMKHILLVSPFLWDPEFGDYTFEGRRIVWLLAVPISEREYRFALSRGADQLEDLFEQKQINLFDIQRRSVL